MKTFTIRNVEEEIARKLAVKAAKVGKSREAYILTYLINLANHEEKLSND